MTETALFRRLARETPRGWSRLRFELDVFRDDVRDRRQRIELTREGWVRVADWTDGDWVEREAGEDLLEPRLGVPMWDSYHGPSLLAPRELADGFGWSWPGEDPETLPGPLRFKHLAMISSGGRKMLDAVVQPTDDYDPLCPCCPLLDGARGHVQQPPHKPAKRFTVRLDVATGVCVIARPLDRHVGYGHVLRRFEVDP
ncbi:hypothetical protein NLX83_13990 [Allokutzneria sp. A3M-2-11 16]|uniref:hypothetical protein n=1 Tax=Allokutzneria sp. A3M-2-11 16 TaxID=2962043 RepID=UPI0020B65F60|nr:hypothetical protein [Allokutzneria sp. A3M-2-11 16]MCP3800371.1 hypothetical protein [Allokutzneria sp. A3M-2-11 16]